MLEFSATFASKGWAFNSISLDSVLTGYVLNNGLSETYLHVIRGKREKHKALRHKWMGMSTESRYISQVHVIKENINNSIISIQNQYTRCKVIYIVFHLSEKLYMYMR